MTTVLFFFLVHVFAYMVTSHHFYDTYTEYSVTIRSTPYRVVGSNL
jgi:hypothetical protein